MISFDEAADMLDEIADSLPQELYRELNGGIVVVPEFKIHNKAVDNDLYIMGEYHRDSLGKYVIIYYGSFERVYPSIGKEELREQLKKTLVHEIRHHNEYLAGYRDLEVYDEDRINDYLNNKKARRLK